MLGCALENNLRSPSQSMAQEQKRVYKLLCLPYLQFFFQRPSQNIVRLFNLECIYVLSFKILRIYLSE